MRYVLTKRKSTDFSRILGVFSSRKDISFFLNIKQKKLLNYNFCKLLYIDFRYYWTGQLSVRKLFTGSPLLLNKFGIEVLSNAKRTATGS